MVTKFPAAIDDNISVPILIDSVSGVSASSVNIVRNTIIAVETELGVKPSGLYSTVRARLDAIESELGGVQGTITFAGDLTGNNSSQTVVGLRGRPISITAASPAAGQALIYSGATWAPGTNFGTQNITTSGVLVSGPALSTSAETGLFTLDGKFIINGITTTSPSNPGQAIIYYDSGSDKVKVSENGGAYVNLLTADAITFGPDLSGTVSSQVVVSLTGSAGKVVALADTLQFGTAVSIGTIGTNKSAASLVLQAGVASTVLTATTSLFDIVPATRLDSLAGNGDGYVNVDNAGNLSFGNFSSLGTAITLGGDVIGPGNANTVIKLQGNPLLSQSLGASQDGYILTWVNGDGYWEAKPTTDIEGLTNITGNYNVVLSDRIVSVGSIGSGITITLPSSAVPGQIFMIKDAGGNASTYNIIVDGNGHNIDGTSTITLNQNYVSVSLVWLGSSWGVL